MLSKKKIKETKGTTNRLRKKNFGNKRIIFNDFQIIHLTNIMTSMHNPTKFPLILYKRILRLHYGLPKELKIIGDGYVKEEFRRHKNATPEHTLLFLKEWTEYCTSLSKQLTGKGLVKGNLGENLNPQIIDKMDEDKLYQLYELKLEADKSKNC